MKKLRVCQSVIEIRCRITCVIVREIRREIKGNNWMFTVLYFMQRQFKFLLLRALTWSYLKTFLTFSSFSFTFVFVSTYLHTYIPTICCVEFQLFRIFSYVQEKSRFRFSFDFWLHPRKYEIFKYSDIRIFILIRVCACVCVCELINVFTDVWLIKYLCFLLLF